MTTQIKSITYAFKDGQTFATIVSQPYLELANGEMIEDPRGVHQVSFEITDETLSSHQIHLSHDETCALCDVLKFDQDVITASVAEYRDQLQFRESELSEWEASLTQREAALRDEPSTD